MIRFEFGFEPDPDDGEAATPEMSSSWGWFKIHVDGRNLCAHAAHDSVHSAVHWYLLPMLEWFVENWDRLLHESRLPAGLERRTGARESWLATDWADLEPADSAAVDDWWRAHALRSAAEGGVFPDVFIRRHGDHVEVSWGRAGDTGTGSKLAFLEPAGRRLERADYFAEALYGALKAAVDELGAQCDAPRVTTLRESLASLPRKRCEPARLLAGWGAQISAAQQKLLNAVKGLVLYPAPAPLVLFGSLAPNISEADIHQVLTLLERAESGRSLAISDLEQAAPDGPAYEQGYQWAERVRAHLDLRDDEAPDLPAILERLSIQEEKVSLEDAGIRGLAIDGGPWGPVIAVNESSPLNQSEPGRRFTLAHELCHLLFDRSEAAPLALASGDSWTAPEIEQRANAFAAMFLMPPRFCRLAIDQHVPDGRWTSQALRSVAASLRTGRKATGKHLINLHLIPPGSRYLWEAD